MALNSIFAQDIPLSSLETYDSNIIRTINSTPILPWTVDDLCVGWEFSTADTYNLRLERIYDNLDYLRGFTTIYNSILPLESVVCPEYTSGLGFDINPQYEITFDNSQVSIYQNGVLNQTITGTELGEFFNVRDVILQDDNLFILDDNYVVYVDINGTHTNLLTFWGGLGGSEQQYKFSSPTQLIWDEQDEILLVLDSGNNRVVVYNSNLQYLISYTANNVISIDYCDGILYQLKSDVVEGYQNGQLISSHSHGMTPTYFEIDDVQAGFMWIGNASQINKYTIDGFLVGSYPTQTKARNIVRYGTNTFVVSDTISRNLDYQVTDSILSSSFSDYSYPLSATLFDKNEMTSDLVFNDSFIKINSAINSLNSAIINRFVSTFDLSSALEEITVEPFNPEPIEMDCGCWIRQDEIHSCYSWKRAMGCIYDQLLALQDSVLGREVVRGLSSTDVEDYIPINWSLSAQSCEGKEPQLFNPSFTPISWTELQNPALSCIPLTSSSCSLIE